MYVESVIYEKENGNVVRPIPVNGRQPLATHSRVLAAVYDDFRDTFATFCTSAVVCSVP